MDGTRVGVVRLSLYGSVLHGMSVEGSLASCIYWQISGHRSSSASDAAMQARFFLYLAVTSPLSPTSLPCVAVNR